MKILYIAGNPDGAVTLQIEKEVNQLQEELDAVTTSEIIDLRVYSHLRFDQLPSIIGRLRPDILHFSAHGREDGIVLAHEERGEIVLDGPRLARLLRALDVSPRLIVINACNSAAMAADVASDLTFVIGTDAPVSNVAARTMATTLYQRLANASSIGGAFDAASTMLELVDLGGVRAELFPVSRQEVARRIRLSDPMRIIACCPEIEKCLDNGLGKPRNRFRPEKPGIQFGLAGVPAAARQTQLFTDDESVQPAKGESLEDARSWIIETRASRGEIWIEPFYSYYGDMQWYASVTTDEHALVSAVSSTVEALQRYYFDEEWRGPLPAGIADALRETIANLRNNDGSRKGRRKVVKIAPAG